MIPGAESTEPRRDLPDLAQAALEKARAECRRMQAEGIAPQQVSRTLGCAPDWGAIGLKIALRLLRETREALP